MEAAGGGAAGGGGGGFDPKMLQQFGGMMGGGGSSGQNGGSQGNWMADIANAQKDQWTQYIDSTQQPNMGMPAASTAKKGQPQGDNGRSEKISAIKDYIDAAARASELKKQQQEPEEKKELVFETA